MALTKKIQLGLFQYRRSWKQILQDICAVYSLIMIRIFGLWPYAIDRRSKDFKSTWFLKLQPILMGIIFLITFSVIYLKLLPSLYIQWKSDAAKVLMTIFGTLNTFSSLLTYICVYLQTQRVKSIIVRSEEFLVKSQRLLTDDTIRTVSAFLLYLFKSFFLLACFTALVCFKMYIGLPLLPAYVIPFLVLPVVMNATLPNLFFGVILVATVYFERINAKISEIVRIANLLTLQKHKNFGQMHRYCELSDLFDELAVLHMELTRLTQDVCKVANLYMTGYIAWLIINAIVQKFFVSMLISNSLKHTIAFQPTLLAIGLLNIAFVWIELIMFAYLCFTIMQEVVLNLLPNELLQ